jgi:hypothetical protein
MTNPPLTLSVGVNTADEIKRLTQEIAALQLRINSAGGNADFLGGNKRSNAQLKSLQDRLLLLTDPTASASARITPSPTSGELPVFAGSPLIDVGRVGVTDLKFINRSD